jgi:aminopeptidase N
MCRASLSNAVAASDLLTEADARERAARVSEVSYDVRLELQSGSEDYRGEVGLAFTLTGASEPLRLDLRAAALQRLTANGQPVPAACFDGSKVLLPAAVLREGPNRVEVTYRNAFSHSGNGFHRFVDPEDSREYLYTDFEPFFAHRMMPCFDQPDLKAVFRVTVAAPSGWTVIGNSAIRSAEPEGESVRHVLEPTPPIPTYLLFLAAGHFVAFEDEGAEIPARLYVREAMTRYVPVGELFGLVRAGLVFYQDYFGCAYPFSKYDQVFVPEMNLGAMENPGAVSVNEVFLFRREPTRRERERRAEVILHEMSHMWFGDLVTMRWWDGLWLNESFATYVSHVALAQATEFVEAFEDFLFSLKQWAYWQDQLPTTHPVAGRVPDTNVAASNFDGITYGKGAALLSQLAFFLGPEPFREGLRLYFEEHAWGNTELSDFFSALGRAASRDLSEWSRIHLETSGVNELVPCLEVIDGRVSACGLEQRPGNGDSRPRPQRLEVAAYTLTLDGELELRQVVPVTVGEGLTPVPGLQGVPEPAFVWANHGDHAYARVMLDPTSLGFALERMDRIRHGLTRRGVWLTLWEMMRDGRLAPSVYLEAFLRHTPLEPDMAIVQLLSRNLGRVLGEYLPEQHHELKAAVHELAWARLLAAPPATDAQKVWCELAADAAFTPAALTRLESLLDGRQTIPGLELDPERRWKMVVRLCSHGRLGCRDRIEAQLALDGSAIGQRQAFKARAALPDAETKGQAWARFTSDAGASLEELRAGMEGFHWPHQAALTSQFVAPFFQALPALRREREPELADAFAEHLFPKYLFEREVLQRTGAFIACNRELPEDVYKPLANAADELARALRLRAM